MNQEPLDSTPQQPETDAQRAERLRARRRRFIRLGASTVPVSLTLASRPVMAWHCYTTSAWGSQRADGIQKGTSVYNRLEANQGTTRIEGDECWYIDNWKNNTGRSGGPSRYQNKPWTYVGKKLTTLTGDKSDTAYANYAKNNLKVSHVFPNGIKGCSGNATCWSLIQSGTTNWAGLVMVAGLNRKYAEGAHQAVMDKCLRPNQYSGVNQLEEMARLGENIYSPPGTKYKWDLADLKSYLNASYLAV